MVEREKDREFYIETCVFKLVSGSFLLYISIIILALSRVNIHFLLVLSHSRSSVTIFILHSRPAMCIH